MLARLLFVVVALGLSVWLWLAGTPAPPAYPTPVRDEGGLLSPRERQIACLVAQGFYNKEIANMLGITIQTVKNHIKEAHRKTGTRGRTDLAIFAYRHWRAGWEQGPSDGVVLYG